MTVLYHSIEPSAYIDYKVTKEPELSREISFTGGERITEPLPVPLVFEVDYPKGEEAPHCLGQVISLFSDRLLQQFREAGVDNFQTFPAVLRNPATGEEWKNYQAFNALGLVRWVNMAESEYDTIMEGSPDGVDVPLLGFQTIVLDKKKTRDELLMFRLAESPPSLLIHTRVKKHLVANKPRGGWRFTTRDVDVR